MFELLRTTESSHFAQSSHVVVLAPNGVCSNWFTATPNPKEPVFKPFIFTFGARVSSLTMISDAGDTNLLHKLHSQRKWDLIGNLLKSLESSCVEEVLQALEKWNEVEEADPKHELDDLFKDCVEAEIKFYR